MPASLVATGFMELAELITQYAQALPTRVEQAVGTAGVDVVLALAQATPRKSGDTANAWRAEVTNNGGMVTLTVSAPGNHPSGPAFEQILDWLEDGRGPVEATSKRALSWPGADHPVRSVGAASGHPFAQQTFDQAVTGFQDKVWAEIMEGFPE